MCISYLEVAIFVWLLINFYHSLSFKNGCTSLLVKQQQKQINGRRVFAALYIYMSDDFFPGLFSLLKIIVYNKILNRSDIYCSIGYIQFGKLGQI